MKVSPDKLQKLQLKHIKSDIPPYWTGLYETRGSAQEASPLVEKSSLLVENKQIDFEGFRQYLLSHKKRNVKQVLLNAKKYGYILQTKDANQILSFSNTKRRHIMESLVSLSKYLGAYPVWKEIQERYQLKWSNQDGLEVFQSIFNNEKDYPVMLDWLKDSMSKIPKPYANILMFNALTGLRPNEACQSVSLLHTEHGNYLKQEGMILEHYKYPAIFIRNSKKAFISIVNEEILQVAEEAHNCSYQALRSCLKKRRLTMNMAYCRKIFATYMRKKGIESEIIDLLQGRTPKSVFARHYFRPDFENEMKRVGQILKELHKELLAAR